jgi:L-aspartate oxidase
VLQPADSIESHINDTKIGGAGLCDDEAVRITVEEGPQRVLELLSWGINFDKQAGQPVRPRVHARGRAQLRAILHAYGDATGRELAQTLINTVRAQRTSASPSRAS